MALPDKLKEARMKANLSQAEMAEKIGLNQRTYGSYERGERDVSTALLRKICQALKVSSDELLENYFEDSPDPAPTKKSPPLKISRSEGQSLLSELDDAEKAELYNYLGYLRYKRNSGI